MFKQQRAFYENFHLNLRIGKIEAMKQALRLETISGLTDTRCQENKRVLIAGCGSGGDTSVFKHKVVAFDVSLNAIKNAEKYFPGNAYIVADGITPPFIDQSFDCIICSEVLEHIMNPRKMIEEFHRILKNDGQLVITVPNWICWYGIARKIAEFILGRPVTACDQPVDNWYTLHRLRKEMEAYFEIVQIRGAWYYPPIAKGYHKKLESFIFPVFRIFQPLDVFWGRVFPSLGSHILAVSCIKNIAGTDKS